MSKQGTSSSGKGTVSELSLDPKRGCLLWSLATSSNRACSQRGASCQHPILAYRLPTRESLIKARVTIHHPAIKGERATGEELGPLEKLKRAVGRTYRQRTPKTAELALRHYSSPSHRSTERCPIWDSKNPSQCQVTNDTFDRISGACHISRDTPIPHGRLF
ncbi:hypothetical protein CRG98_019647 [Punica granatum]|uniref:Uncharacterized protein n=1 Tax=Punica granatum TaxID=22663 RepID=A0A2I0JVQ2_PUNGR|nr:hypothetical protein CRG98_019647 [Punica granatum]